MSDSEDRKARRLDGILNASASRCREILDRANEKDAETFENPGEEFQSIMQEFECIRAELKILREDIDNAGKMNTDRNTLFIEAFNSLSENVLDRSCFFSRKMVKLSRILAKSSSPL